MQNNKKKDNTQKRRNTIMNKMTGGILLLLLMFIMVSHETLVSHASTTETDSYTITINNSNEGHTYGAYQIFGGTISGNVLVDIEWGAAITDATDYLTKLVASTEAGFDFTGCESANDVANVLKNSEVSDSSSAMNAFAEFTGSYLITQGTSPTATASYNESTSMYSVTVSTGYYLIKDETAVTGQDATTLYILDVAKDITVAPKSDIPTVEKKVLEDTTINNQLTGGNDENYNDVADWDMNQVQSFRLYGEIPADFTEIESYETYRFIFHDTYAEGISFPAEFNYSVAYRIGGVETAMDADSFSYTINEESNELTFTCEDLIKVLGVDILKQNPTIVITYSAYLNTSAVVGLDGNVNEVYLEFSNDPYNSSASGTHTTGETQTDAVIVFTYGLEAAKVDSETSQILEGAVFQLKNTKNEWAVVTDGKLVEWVESQDNATELISDKEGNFSVVGLDADTYYLEEIAAPDGYNMLQTDIQLVITSMNDKVVIYQQHWNSFEASDGLTDIYLAVDAKNAVAGDAQSGMVYITIENSVGVTLPETGGSGTMMLYVFGGIMVLGVAIIFVTKKRMEL